MVYELLKYSGTSINEPLNNNFSLHLVSDKVNLFISTTITIQSGLERFRYNIHVSLPNIP